MALYDTSIRRPVATTMSFLVVIVVGAVSFYYLPVDLLPEIEYPQVSVTTSYPNVGPEEMEQIITDPVANAVSSVSNVERITSQSSEGSSRVNMEFGQGTDLNAADDSSRVNLGARSTTNKTTRRTSGSNRPERSACSNPWTRPGRTNSSSSRSSVPPAKQARIA